MAINDISLTSGMRSNLLSLQGTVNLLDRTQARLSTGKKVNTAMDNPVSFFAAQSLNARASVIDSLKDAMGQAVQTIIAADKGIAAISSMIEQSKGIAQSALSAETGGAAATGAVTLSGVSASQPYATATLTLDGVINSEFFMLFIDAARSTARTFDAMEAPNPMRTYEYQLVSGDMVATAENLADVINNFNWVAGGAERYYTAEYHAGTNTLTLSKFLVADDSQLDFEAADFLDPHGTVTAVVNPAGGSADQIDIGGVTFTATTGATGGQNFNVSGNDTADMVELAKAINDYAWGDTAFSATVTNGKLILSKTVGGVDASVEAGDFDASGVTHGAAAMDIVQSSSELESLQNQYNTLRTQLTELAGDAGYKGKNLLNNADIIVKFEGASLTVEGFGASAADLGISEAAWTNEASINESITQMDQALSKLRAEASKMAGNLSIIDIRQNFSTNIINTLTAGADKFRLPDVGGVFAGNFGNGDGTYFVKMEKMWHNSDRRKN